MIDDPDLTEPAFVPLRQRFGRLPWRGVVADLVASLLAAGVLVVRASHGGGLAVRLAGLALVLAAPTHVLPRLRSRQRASIAVALVVAATGVTLALAPEGSLPLSALAGSALALALVGVEVVLMARALLAPLRRARAVCRRVRTALAAVPGLGVLVVVGLALNGASITSDGVANDRARSGVTAWLGEDADLAIASVDVDGPDVQAVLAGPGSPPSADALAARLSSRLDRQV